MDRLKLEKKARDFPRKRTDPSTRLGLFPHEQLRLYKRIKIERANGLPVDGDFISDNMQQLLIKYKPVG